MKLVCCWLLSILLLLPTLAVADTADPMASVAPLAPGSAAVACSNLAQDFSRLGGGNAEDYWEGTPFDGQYHYISQLLSEPTNALHFAVTPPTGGLFPRFGGGSVEYVALLCYPTSSGNARSDFALPNGKAIPRMERAGDAPLFADASVYYPLLVYSHGLSGSPLSGDYLDSLTRFASYGYAVLGIFHGDPRFSRVRLEDLGDYAYLLRHFDEVVEMQALRPLSVSAALDTVLGDARYRDHIDASRIGIFGTSLGGETGLLAVGGKLTATLGLSSQRVTQDTRIKAVAGYVPYSGQRILPAFGDDQNGTEALAVPYLGISGTADTTAPIDLTAQAINRMAGTRYLVAFNGIGHVYEAALIPDIYTWTVSFFDAMLRDDRNARIRLSRMQEVKGGVGDSLRIDVLQPLPAANGEALVTEFYNMNLRHFFITASGAEAAGIDAGAAGPGWMRTGLSFKANALGATVAPTVCRFYGTPGVGPNSHFYTASAAECAVVKNDPGWHFEGFAFAVDVPQNGVCAPDRIPVFRAYNERYAQNDSNHRYTSSHSVYAETIAAGWRGEGAVFCALP